MVDPPRERALSELHDGSEATSAAVAGPLIPDALNGVLVLVRHGESTFVAEGRFQGQADPPLSEAGSRHAGLVADRLSQPDRAPALPIPDGPPVEIVHSPLRRAASTAQAVAAALGRPGAFGQEPPRRADPGLMEMGQGEWEGHPATEIAERWGEALAVWRRRPTEAWAPGGESLRDVDRRVRASLAGVLATLAGAGRRPVELADPSTPLDRPVERGHVLGYGTDDMTRPWTIVVAHEGTFRVALLALLDLPLERFWAFPFALCGISVVELHEGEASLRAHNLTDHLWQPGAAADAEASRAIEAARAESGAL
ncbi:MAG TPA: histidine phosphatase family protein [Candidatus Limnocylindrales bacterium]